MKHSSQAYVPDDSGIAVEALNFLKSAPGEGLRAAVAGIFAQTSEPTVAQIATLRKGYSAAYVQAALTLGRLQAKATGGRGKFPGWAYVWGTPEALEQATGMRVSRHKALRFKALEASSIVDFCAGIGGDALGFSEIAPVTTVDISAVRLRCLELNAEERPSTAFGIQTCAEDVCRALEHLPSDALFHIDPARRSAGRRSPHWGDLIPGPDVIEQVTRHFRGGGIKLSPAVDFDSLPDGHLEIISDRGVVVQAMLWVGEAQRLFSSGTRTATVLGAGESWSFEARAGPVALAEIPQMDGRRMLWELDGALTRAGVAGEYAAKYGLQALTSDGGYLLGDSNAFEDPPAVTGFEILQIVRYSEKRVAEVLAEMPATGVEAGAVEVKSRGHVPGVDTDKLQIAWSKGTRSAWTVLLFGRAGEVWAAVGKRRDRRLEH